MQIKSRILTTLRVLNTIIDNLEKREYIDMLALYKAFNTEPPENLQPADSREVFKDYDRDMPDDYLVKLLDKAGIPKEDYILTANILKSMALMTKGHLKSLRNPEGFNPNKAHPWSEYFKTNEHLYVLLKHLGVDLSADVTRDDYALANKMLRVLGSSITDEEEVRKMFENLGIEQEFGITQKVADEEKNLQISKTLYRGLQRLSLRAYKKVTTVGYIWDIGKSVSTSMMREVAENFASEYQGEGYSILFVINNPKRQGFLADKLSAFQEDEVILSGRLKVTGFEHAWVTTPYAIIYVDLI
ncbi:MAG TPA: hypothetical protein DD671_02815 [Balneolaceae bacterium]|nr:hypothetical protein [Balneolaceae bacterium]|tara:strand:+ start:23 stop:925 length:903 start_codon:yes stop_codon:yes gene_type:complete